MYDTWWYTPELKAFAHPLGLKRGQRKTLGVVRGIGRDFFSTFFPVIINTGCTKNLPLEIVIMQQKVSCFWDTL